MKKVLILTFGILLISSVLFAQRQSGAIEGIVQDSNGMPIPGVNVTASSPSLIGGSSNTVTDRNGYYRIPGLASGMYEVKAELAGFQTLIRQSVDLSIGFTLTVYFTLEMNSLSEIVEVIEKPPLIDMSTTAVAFTVPPEIVQNLPNFQQIVDILKLTPGVGEDFIAYGGDGTKANNVSIDGLTLFHPNGGYVAIGYSYNWIEEAYVTGIGAPAEYGGFTGIAANFTTRSGGNQFHGLFETFFQNEDLTSRNTPDPGPESSFQSYDFSAQLGGPILKNKLWFFAGIEYPHKETQTLDYDSVTTDSQSKFITKLTYKLNPNNTLQGFANRNYQDTEYGETLYTPQEVLNEYKNSQTSWNATWMSLWSSDTTFEGRLGGFNVRQYEIETEPDVSGRYDEATGIQSANSNGHFDWRAERFEVNADVSHYARDFIHGSHDFRFGVEFERSNAYDAYLINGDATYLDYAGAPYFRYIWGWDPVEDSNDRTSTYVQDEWKIANDLTLSLGLRWDHNRGNTDRGQVFETDPVAPRIGFVWLLNQNTQTVLKAHYGDYYQALLGRDFSFLNDRVRPAILEEYINGQWVEVSRFFNAYIRDEELKHPYVRQFSIGIDRVLPGEIPFGAHYIYRKFGNILEDIGVAEFEAISVVNPLTGETVIVYVPKESDYGFMLTNPAGLYRRYDAFEFYANKQFGTKLNISGSFVFSKLRGNSPGDYTFAQAATPFIDTPNSLINFPGRLQNDPTFAWKIFGIYALPWGFNTGFYFRHETGDSWTPIVRVEIPNKPDAVFFGEEAGSRRLPSQNLLDLRLEKQVQFYKGQVRFTVDIFNVFNRGYPLRVSNEFGNFNFERPRFYNEPRTMRVGIRYTF